MSLIIKENERYTLLDEGASGRVIKKNDTGESYPTKYGVVVFGIISKSPSLKKVFDTSKELQDCKCSIWRSDNIYLIAKPDGVMLMNRSIGKAKIVRLSSLKSAVAFVKHYEAGHAGLHIQ